MADTPGIADVRLGREEGRPEIAIRVDRPKAAMLGMTRAERRQHDPDQRRRARRPRSTASAATSTRSSCGCAKRIARAISDVGDVLVSTPGGQVVPARNLLAVDREAGPVADRSQEHGADHARERRDRDHAQRRGRRPCRRASARSACRPTSPSASAPRSRSRRSRSSSSSSCSILAVLLVYAVMASQYESLRDPFIIMFSIPVAGDRRRRRRCC